MNRRLLIAGVAAAAVVGTVVPSFAAFPITVQESTDNGVSVGVLDDGNTVVGATVSPDGRVCAGISRQVPQCAGGGLGVTGPSVRQKLPVSVTQSDSGTLVQAGQAGVFVGNDGHVCTGYSTQDWPCIGHR